MQGDKGENAYCESMKKKCFIFEVEDKKELQDIDEKENCLKWNAPLFSRKKLFRINQSFFRNIEKNMV